MNVNYHAKLKQTRQAIREADAVLMELGVGYNTPTIIKFPFEQLAAQSPHATLIRLNRDAPEIGSVNRAKTIIFSEKQRAFRFYHRGGQATLLLASRKKTSYE